LVRSPFGVMAPMVFSLSVPMKTAPPRGPRRVLWVVVVVKSAILMGLGCSAGGNKAGDVGHVHHEQGSHFIRNGPETVKVYDPGVGTGTGHDQFWLALPGQPGQLIVIDGLGFTVHAVPDHIVHLAGEGNRCAVGQVASMGKVHAKDGIPGCRAAK
jgi:hypothetical protein